MSISLDIFYFFRRLWSLLVPPGDNFRSDDGGPADDGVLPDDGPPDDSITSDDGLIWLEKLLLMFAKGIQCPQQPYLQDGTFLFGKTWTLSTSQDLSILKFFIEEGLLGLGLACLLSCLSCVNDASRTVLCHLLRYEPLKEFPFLCTLLSEWCRCILLEKLTWYSHSSASYRRLLKECDQWDLERSNILVFMPSFHWDALSSFLLLSLRGPPA